MMIRHRLLICIVLLLILAVIPPVSALQNSQATPIQVGQSGSGQVVDNQTPTLY